MILGIAALLLGVALAVFAWWCLQSILLDLDG